MSGRKMSDPNLMAEHGYNIRLRHSQLMGFRALTAERRRPVSGICWSFFLALASLAATRP
jgi:hypothetical protein